VRLSLLAAITPHPPAESHPIQHTLIDPPTITRIALLGRQIQIALCCQTLGDGGYSDFIEIRSEGRRLVLPEGKVRPLDPEPRAYWGGSVANAFEAVISAFASPLIVTRHQGLVDYLCRQWPEAANWTVSPHAKADEVKGRVVVGVLPAWLAAEALLHVEIPLDMTLTQRGAELDALEVARIAGPPRIYSVEGL